MVNKKDALKNLSSLRRYLALIVDSPDNGFLKSDLDDLDYVIKLLKTEKVKA